MIRKLILLGGAAFLGAKFFNRPNTKDGRAQPASPPASTRFDGGAAAADTDMSPGHAPTDLSGDRHPDGSARAEDHYRPDPTAPVSPEDRESLRPVTAPAPHDPPTG
ncbi:MAG: hypothetical protein QHC40_12235 [Sphingobium sp.]|nr:hypothetical protein [Sphingobium sp.]